MNITNVTVITTAEAKTENAVYGLEYSVSNGTLIRATANILEPGGLKSDHQTSIGNIYLDQDIVTCNLPEGRNLVPYFMDFDMLLKTIRENIAQPAN